MAPARTLSVVLLLGAVLAASAALQEGDNRKADFDYFYLVRQWPATFCNEHYCTHRPPKKYAFTVHGLWPQRRDGTWPEFCDSSSELDVDEIEDLLPDLEKAWPSWSSDDETFWNHEWTRHGTCAEGIVGHQHAFFHTVLRLHDKLNIQEAFEARGIVPSNYARYHIEALKHALDNAYGVMPHITCDAQGELAEVWMCIDKKLRPIDCVEGPHPHRAAQLSSSTGITTGSAEDSATAAAAAARVPANFNCNLVKIPKLDKTKFKAAKKAAKAAKKAAKCHKKHEEEHDDDDDNETAEQQATAADASAAVQAAAGLDKAVQQPQEQQPAQPMPSNNAQQLRAMGIAANKAALAAAAAATAEGQAGAADIDRPRQLPAWITGALLVAAAVAMVAAVALWAAVELQLWAGKPRAEGCAEAREDGSIGEERSPLIVSTSM